MGSRIGVIWQHRHSHSLTLEEPSIPSRPPSPKPAKPSLAPAPKPDPSLPPIRPQSARRFSDKGPGFGAQSAVTSEPLAALNITDGTSKKKPDKKKDPKPKQTHSETYKLQHSGQATWGSQLARPSLVGHRLQLCIRRAAAQAPVFYAHDLLFDRAFMILSHEHLFQEPRTIFIVHHS